jgi:hypothetical protein
MKLTKIGGECGKDDCPAVYATDTGSVVVQGTVLAGVQDVKLGVGEGLVEIPYSVLLEAASAASR